MGRRASRANRVDDVPATHVVHEVALARKVMRRVHAEPSEHFVGRQFLPIRGIGLVSPRS